PLYSEAYTITARMTNMTWSEAFLWFEGAPVDTHAEGTIGSWQVQHTTPPLTAGERYDVRLEIMRWGHTGNIHGTVELQWSSASQPSQAIPAARMHPDYAGDIPSYEYCGGSILRELWLNAPGSLPSDVPVDRHYDGRDRLPALEAQAWESPYGTTDAGDNYGQRIRGFLTPYEDGDYDFWIAADEQAELWLSYTEGVTGGVSGEVANKTRIAWVSQATAQREWNAQTTQRASTNVGTITLERGHMYYIEVLHKESSGGDHVAVGWRKPSDGPGDTPSEVIPGRYLSPMPQFPVTAHPCRTDQAFADLMWQSRELWPLGSDDLPQLDSTGYPAEAIPYSGDATMSWPIYTAVPIGTELAIRWDGDGEVDIRLSSSTVTSRQANRITVRVNEWWFWIWIRRSNAADPVRNIRIVPTALEATYDPSAPFNPQFMSTLDNVGTIRFMGWQNINSNNEVHWSDRTPPYWFRKVGREFIDVNGQESRAGANLEMMIELCNQAGANAWFCVPHAADSNYMVQMARTIRDNLDPTLKCYIEYSNETWNFGPGFRQFHDIMGNTDSYYEWLGDTLVPSTLDHNIFVKTGWLSNRVFTVFRDEWDNAAGPAPTLVRVAALQGENLTQPRWLEENVGSGSDPGFDAVSPSGYFAGHGAIPRDDLVDAINGGTMTVAEAVDAYYERAELKRIGYGDNVRAYIDEVQERCNCDIEYVQYETGEHFSNYQEGDSGPAHDLLMGIQTHPRIYELYMRAFQLYDRFDVTASNILCWIGNLPRFGHRLDIYSDVDSSEVRKWRALVDAMDPEPGYPPLVGEGATVGAVMRRAVSPMLPLASMSITRSFTAAPALHYRLSSDARVRITVYNAAGRVVQTLVNRSQKAGTYLQVWNTRTTGGASGFYCVVFEAHTGGRSMRLAERFCVMQ
ncbi:MAG: hypothetical protein GF331_22265, partial [Chitinivibrionales bacterium]|nr:hypothetical protein [Chitinivibrionales bacterium]